MLFLLPDKKSDLVQTGDKVRSATKIPRCTYAHAQQYCAWTAELESAGGVDVTFAAALVKMKDFAHYGVLALGGASRRFLVPMHGD